MAKFCVTTSHPTEAPRKFDVTASHFRAAHALAKEKIKGTGHKIKSVKFTAGESTLAFLKAMLKEGGPGSGNFGHAGRAGEVGGSSGDGGGGGIGKEVGGGSKTSQLQTILKDLQGPNADYTDVEAGLVKMGKIVAGEKEGVLVKIRTVLKDLQGPDSDYATVEAGLTKIQQLLKSSSGGSRGGKPVVPDIVGYLKPPTPAEIAQHIALAPTPVKSMVVPRGPRGALGIMFSKGKKHESLLEGGPGSGRHPGSGWAQHPQIRDFVRNMARYRSKMDKPARDRLRQTIHTIRMMRNAKNEGGPGSGNFGHAGRAGEVGGSGGGGGGGKEAGGGTPYRGGTKIAGAEKLNSESTLASTLKAMKYWSPEIIGKDREHELATEFAKGLLKSRDRLSSKTGTEFKITSIYTSEGPGGTTLHAKIGNGKTTHAFFYHGGWRSKGGGFAENLHTLALSMLKEGGPGSGNFGHAGRAGEVGGSGSPTYSGKFPSELWQAHVRASTAVPPLPRSVIRGTKRAYNQALAQYLKTRVGGSNRKKLSPADVKSLRGQGFNISKVHKFLQSYEIRPKDLATALRRIDRVTK